MANNLKLNGKMVTLIPMVAGDKDAFFELATQSDGSKFWYDAKQKKSLTKTAFFSDWKDTYFNSSFPDNGQCFWIIFEGRRVGQVNYNEIDTQNLKTELDIIIGNEADMGKGIGSDALETSVRYLFQTFQLHKVWIEARSDNKRAIKAYEKAGFHIEARLKDEYFFEGSFVDGIRLVRFAE